jgi:hypothetical protein
MAKHTLLEMVQSIMSDMDSDIVDHITDTVEAGQVASVLQDVYEQMIANQMIPELDTLGRLSTVSLIDHPGATNYLEIPSNYTQIGWIKYDIQDVGATSVDYATIDYLTPSAFMDLINRNQADDGNVVQATDPGTSGVTYYVKNDVSPRYWTSFDDHYIAFDARLVAVDATQIVGTKSQTMAKTVPVWTVSDSFTPSIDENLFPYLLAEAKSTCFVNLKQQANPKVDKQSRDQRVRIQNHKFRTNAAQKKSTSSTGPNFGRN